MTHENAMRFFRFDPYSIRPREKCTVGALRAEAVGPRRLDPVEGPAGRAQRADDAGRVRRRRRELDHVRHNRAFWDADADSYQAAHGDALAHAPLAWGAYRVPESELQVLGDVAGRDVLELGCGAAQWSIALARPGRARRRPRRLARAARARPPRPRRRCRSCRRAASSCRSPTRRFDIVFCDHGAMSFCDPEISVAECARLLRPGRAARVLLHAPAAVPHVGRRAASSRPASCRSTTRELGRMALEEGTIDWVLPPGEWIRVLRANGFEVEDLVELCAARRRDDDLRRLRPAEVGAPLAGGMDLEGAPRAACEMIRGAMSV